MQYSIKTLISKIPRNKRTYFLIFIISHILFFVYSYFFGIWYVVISFLLGLITFNLAAELYMHRAITHHQFKFSSKINRILCILFSMCNFGSVSVNSAVHINHHKYVDTNKDPYNFRYIGVLNTIFKNWTDEYLPNRKLLVKFMRNEEVKKQHFNHINYSIISTILFPFIPVVGFWIINLLFIISHLGENIFSSAINLRFLFPVMWGAEMHEDHHNFPTKKKMHDYDIIYYIGNFLELFSLIYE
jgi:fatty-acid desaturase